MITIKGKKMIRRHEKLPDMFVRTVPYLVLREIGRIIGSPGRRISKRKMKDYSHYPSQVARNTKVTYSHCYQLIKRLEDTGLVIRDAGGRERRVKLTLKGEKVLHALTTVMNQLK